MIGFFDTNVLLYIASSEQPKPAETARLLTRGGVISVQVLNEFAYVARRKLRLPWSDIQDLLAFILASCESPAPITLETHRTALSLAERYGYTIYDCLLLASALEQGCDIFYSEDMQDGQRIGDMVIRNPFTSSEIA